MLHRTPMYFGRVRAVFVCSFFLPWALACAEHASGPGVEVFDVITVQVSGAGVGSGRVQSSESFVVLDCPVTNGSVFDSEAPPCGVTFQDAGGGGLFDVYATPGPGDVFTAWLDPSCTAEKPGACDITCGVNPDPPNECTLSFDEDSGDVLFKVTAVFDREGDTREIRLSTSPDDEPFVVRGSGTVMTPEAGYDLDCQIDGDDTSGTCVMLLEGYVGAGSIEVVALPDAGSEFTGWGNLRLCSASGATGSCNIDCGDSNDEPTCLLSFADNSGDVRFSMPAKFRTDEKDITVNVTGAGLGEGVVFMSVHPEWLLCGIVAGHTSGLCSFTNEGLTGEGSYQVIASREGASEFQGWDDQSCMSAAIDACHFDCVANADGEVCELSWDENSGDVTFDMTARFETTLNTVVIEDDFDDAGACADWTSDVVGNGTFSGTDGCELVGGHPNGYRTMTHEVTDVGGVVVSHWYEGGSYDPSSGGAIEEIIYSESRIITQPAFVGGAVGSSFRLRQGGTVYTHTFGSFTDTGWATHSVRLSPVHFTPAPGPDFSAAGSEIQFGYVRSNSNTSAGATSTSVHGIDNWRVVIVQAP